jgi:signal transduction histidine kinase
LKTEFVSIAAHQLRTPLSAIKWTLTTILDGDFGKINKEQKEYLQKTNLSNERMINLVDDLLNLSRIEEGKYVQKNDFFKLGEVVRDIVDSLDIKANKKNIKLNLKEPANLPELLADKEKIRLVVQNLIENAINYSFNGKEVLISLFKNDDKNEVEFKVENVGIGIPKDQRERIFTKFFRAENEVKTETVGSGLGLFINKNIVESHGGRIWFESEENKKIAFYFTIPVKSCLVKSCPIKSLSK